MFNQLINSKRTVGKMRRIFQGKYGKMVLSSGFQNLYTAPSGTFKQNFRAKKFSSPHPLEQNCEKNTFFGGKFYNHVYRRKIFHFTLRCIQEGIPTWIFLNFFRIRGKKLNLRKLEIVIPTLETKKILPPPVKIFFLISIKQFFEIFPPIREDMQFFLRKMWFFGILAKGVEWGNFFHLEMLFRNTNSVRWKFWKSEIRDISPYLPGNTIWHQHLQFLTFNYRYSRCNLSKYLGMLCKYMYIAKENNF